MIRSLCITLILFFICPALYAQFGIGASGGILYPGLLSSDQTNSKFETGWGYELLLQHPLFHLNDSLAVDARYAYRHYMNPAMLPNVLKTWFTLRYLTINLLVDVYRGQNFALYSGAGAALLSSEANRDFFNYTGTTLIPEINFGCKWIPSRHYTLFSEISFQFGSLSDIFNENIPVTGLRFVLGGIMFLSRVEEN